MTPDPNLHPVMQAALAPFMRAATAPIDDCYQELAHAMHAVAFCRQRRAHHNTLYAAVRRLRAVALVMDTNYGAADPDTWAADWLCAVSSGHPDFERMQRIAVEFRASVVSATARDAA